MSYACDVGRSSIADYLLDFARLGRETAFTEPNGYRMVRFNYRDIADAAYRFARELTARKIRKGDRVVVWGPNSAAWVAAFFGCAHRGVVVVPMDYGSSPDFVRRVFQQVNARLLLCSRHHVQPGLPTLFFEDIDQSLAHHSPAAFAPENITRADALEIVFTSGTTAEPKGVVITHRNVLANAGPLEEQIKSYLKYEPFVHPVRFLNLLPLSHVFGQFLGMYLPPLMAGTVVFSQCSHPR
jgi:long-chain acyl-CoA synthetase